jgi:predicted enzyme related to lactoylglutathione lyase
MVRCQPADRRPGKIAAWNVCLASAGTSCGPPLNFRVRDLDAMLAQLRAKGADVAEETQEMAGVGRFGWVADPEGNRVELWQPA